MLQCLRSFDSSSRRLPRGVACALVAMFIAHAAASPAWAVNYTWNNVAGGNWGTAANWTPNGVPNATTDTATIALAGTYTVTVVGSFIVGSVTVGGASGTQTLSLPGGSGSDFLTLNAGAPTATLTVNANGVVNQSPGGKVQGIGGNPAQVTVNGRYDWNGGSIDFVSLTVTPTATLALAGASVKPLQTVQLVNHGTIVNTGTASLQLANNSTVTNAAGGVIDLQSDAGLEFGGGGTSILTNAGMIRKTIGTGTADITANEFNNTGIVDVQAGTLRIASGTTRVVASGAGNAFNAQAGATLVIGSVASPTSFAGTTFGGPGTKTIGAGALPYTLLGTITSTNTTLAGGEFSGTFTLNGTLTSAGARLGGSGAVNLTIPVGATLDVAPFTILTLGGGGFAAQITNNGTINQVGSTSWLEGATLVNGPNGVVNITGTGSLVRAGVGARPSIQNAGTLRRTANSGNVSVIDIDFNNTGTFKVETGALYFEGPVPTFTQTSGTTELAGGTVGAGGGHALQFTGGTLTGTGAIAGRLNAIGGTQVRPGTSPGIITIANANSQLAGSLYVELNGTTPGTGHDQVVAQSGPLTVGGSLVVSIGAALPVGSVVPIVSVSDGTPVVGAFNGLPEGTTFVVQGYTLRISYVGGVFGNQVTLTVVSNSGLPCDAYSDVDGASPFCPNVEWMKKRSVTLGCTAGLFCPTSPTTRLQMALFMNRLGTTLTNVQNKVETAPGPFNPSGNPVLCTTADVAAANYERRTYLDAVFMGLGQGTAEINVALVGSLNSGVTWIQLGPPVPAGTVNGHWANVRVNGDRDVAPNEVMRYGLRITRLSGAGELAASRCVLRMQSGNRNPNPLPDKATEE